MLAEVVPQLAFADTTGAESPSSRTASLDDIQIVKTAEELLNAVNNIGVRHVVIQSHMNITSSNSSASTDLFREVLLRLPQTTKHIQVLNACLLVLSTGLSTSRARATVLMIGNLVTRSTCPGGLRRRTPDGTT